jgi:nicotinamide-nucleotide amidase
MKTRVTELGNKLKARGWQLTTAESCTAGGLAYTLTSVSGSSGWFERGFITYSNVAKQEMLGVRPATIASFGAVSEETAREMADGARHFSKADISIAITGTAGPSGGTPEKPVGTVCFAWSGKNIETVVKTKHLSGSRSKIRKDSILIAINGLLKILKTSKQT